MGEDGTDVLLVMAPSRLSLPYPRSAAIGQPMTLGRNPEPQGTFPSCAFVRSVHPAPPSYLT